MIRYIDIGNQVFIDSPKEDCTQFSWWDTVHDIFLIFNEEQMWNSQGEFRAAFSLAQGKDEKTGHAWDLDRFEGLFPVDEIAELKARVSELEKKIDDNLMITT